MVPYSYDCNDFKFFIAPGFGSSMAYFEHAKNGFDTLYEEGQNGQPSYLTVALHARVIGRPGRFPAIKQVYISHSRLIPRLGSDINLLFSSSNILPISLMSGWLLVNKSLGIGRLNILINHLREFAYVHIYQSQSVNIVEIYLYLL